MIIYWASRAVRRRELPIRLYWPSLTLRRIDASNVTRTSDISVGVNCFHSRKGKNYGNDDKKHAKLYINMCYGIGNRYYGSR